MYGFLRRKAKEAEQAIKEVSSLNVAEYVHGGSSKKKLAAPILDPLGVVQEAVVLDPRRVVLEAVMILQVIFSKAL